MTIYSLRVSAVREVHALELVDAGRSAHAYERIDFAGSYKTYWLATGTFWSAGSLAETELPADELEEELLSFFFAQKVSEFEIGSRSVQALASYLVEFDTHAQVCEVFVSEALTRLNAVNFGETN